MLCRGKPALLGRSPVLCYLQDHGYPHQGLMRKLASLEE